ncbi:cupin domain-containing protein [Paenibacillus sp. SYP-B3998]|uniref:Cupin domain-containing protein n=1 Tax=Paenibacillus sp. SYP-B3998 TaxID=2678564 RepID=A0A6G3ZVP5_9BACL|nr:cupin domain-containing protein [Paenibacillus sp. SYP-B3998]NEW05774.1 cupin domain-containing protein [Paenibacillus sp. SYP-B3998]
MDVRNFLEAALESGTSHRGEGEVSSVELYSQADHESPLRFLYYVEIPPGASIGQHRHKADEEMYVILEGCGLMTVEEETKEVKAGDTILNKPYGSHGLKNNTDDILKLLIYEAALCAQRESEANS